MPGYLIDLDLRDRLALVVGLGPVGLRKLGGLVGAGARVRAVDPAGPPPGLPGSVEFRAEAYRPDHLDGAALAFAAAPPEVNRRVAADARARGVWVNAASDPGQGDFLVPATWRDGPVAVAVSTGGGSPNLAALLRDRAARAVGPEAGHLARLLAEVRPEVIARHADPEDRARVLASVATDRWLDLVRDRGAEAARAELRAWLGLPDDPPGAA